MQALRRFFRWVFPRGEFWNRLAIGSVLLVGGLFVLLVAAICVAIPLATANTVLNDTSFEAHCRESVGLPELVIIKPGKREDWIDTYDCAIYETDGGSYRGCLIHSTRDTPVLVSEFRLEVSRAECDIGFYP